MIKSIQLENKSGYVLRGYVNLPNGASTIVVMLHGWTGNLTEHAGHFRNLSRRLEKENIASLRFDYHGNGESDGEFSDFVFEEAIDDAKRMIKYARSIQGIKRVILLGYSLGGAIASLVTNDEDNELLILWSPAGCMKEHAALCFDRSKKLPNGNGFSAGFEFSHKFVDSINKYDMYQNAKNYHNKVLILHGSSDTTVDPKYSAKYNDIFSDSDRYLIEGAGHGYNEYEQREKLYKLTINFIKNN
ncbi:MAG: alpha/beta fold hydrolase [Bacilli bacterium]